MFQFSSSAHVLTTRCNSPPKAVVTGRDSAPTHTSLVNCSPTLFAASRALESRHAPSTSLETNKSTSDKFPKPLLTASTLLSLVRQTLTTRRCTRSMLGKAYLLASMAANILIGFHRPFADAVKAGVASFMCSYNLLNNSQACQNSYLLNHILKEELGFQYVSHYKDGPQKRYGDTDTYSLEGTSCQTGRQLPPVCLLFLLDWT